MDQSGQPPDNGDDFQSDPRSFEFVNNDANAWLVVPTFSGKPPSACGIDGFSEPIVGPQSLDEWAIHVASMLKDARAIVQRSIKSPQDVERLHLEFWQHVTTEGGLINELGFDLLSVAHRDAFLYSSFVDALRGALGERDVDRSDMPKRFTRLAEAAALLSEWAAGDTGRMVRERARKAGQISGVARGMGGKRDAIEKAIRSLEATVLDRDIPGIVSHRGIASQRYAREVLRDLRGKENRN